MRRRDLLWGLPLLSQPAALAGRPMKNVTQGAELLTELLVQNPLDEVLRVAETTWKTHDDWLG